MSMIYLDFPCAVGDGRQAANFRASNTSDKLRRLQSDTTRLRREIEAERVKRRAAEKALAESRPNEAQLMAQLFNQVANAGRKAA